MTILSKMFKVTIEPFFGKDIIQEGPMRKSFRKLNKGAAMPVCLSRLAVS